MGYATHRKVFGAVILTDKNSLVVARRNVAFDEGTMPYHRKRNSSDRLQHLNWLIGRVGSDIADKDMDEDSSLAPTAPEHEPDDALVVDEPNYNNDDGESSEDEADVVHQLKNLHDHAAFETPCFNDLKIAGSRPYLDLPEQLATSDDNDDADSSIRQREPRKKRKTQHYDPSSTPSKSSPLSRMAHGGKVGLQRAVRSLTNKKKKK